jgi:hypothetical protein
MVAGAPPPCASERIETQAAFSIGNGTARTPRGLPFVEITGYNQQAALEENLGRSDTLIPLAALGPSPAVRERWD